jgi:hypothetical protein
MTLTAALLVLGTMAMSASAQTQAPGAASLHAQIQKATPVVKQAATGSALRSGMDLDLRPLWLRVPPLLLKSGSGEQRGSHARPPQGGLMA